jgi:predicted nucleic-acid-binding protein
VTTFLIDTNCLLSYVTDRDPAQQAAIVEHVESAAALAARLVVLPHVVSEFVYVLQSVYGLEAQSVRELLSSLLATPGLELRESFELQQVLQLWPDPCSDYGDAVIAAAATELRLPVLTLTDPSPDSSADVAPTVSC